jgi:endo-1,4-beta-xylanase
MADENLLDRRSVLLGAAGVAGAAATTLVVPGSAAAAGPSAATEAVPPPLWRTAKRRGIVFGTAMSTRLLPDDKYRRLVNRESSILFSEDDLLWYKLKPTPDSPLDFTYGDQLFDYAKRQNQLVFAAHLVWDEGFGEGWTDDDLWGLGKREAERLLYGTARAMVRRYKGRAAGWIVANEVTDPEGVRGVRTNVPWYNTIGPSYIERCFRIAHEEDPRAMLVLNEFGFETVNEWGDQPGDRQDATLQVIDKLLRDKVPVHALGIQAHLLADSFMERFDARAYRRFLKAVAKRGLKILITELDVLDDGLPANPKRRDKLVAQCYRRYLDVALDEPAVKSVMTFGLSDKHTWLQEDYPREDGARRRPLPFDQQMKRKPAYRALRRTLAGAPKRRPIWQGRLD